MIYHVLHNHFEAKNREIVLCLMWGLGPKSEDTGDNHVYQTYI